jgi:hypothetical protein
MLGIEFPPGWRRQAAAARSCFLDGEGRPTPDGAILLGRLAKFCYAQRSTVKVSLVLQQVDPIATAAAEGRREVWMLLMQYLTLSEHDTMRATMASDSATQGDAPLF